MLSSSQRSANASRSLQPQQDDVYVAAQYNALLQLQPLGHAKANQTQDGYGRDVMDTELLDKVTNRSNDLRWNKGVVTWADESPTDSKSGLIYSERRFDEVVSPTAMLSDARIPDKDKRRINDWTVWLNDFKRFRQQILPDAVDPENQQRIRVTVIDTGIDGSHPYMQLKGWRSQDENAITDDQDDPVHLFCDFVEPDSARKHEPIDEDGHGTFIAGILLQAAPDIELSIARIGATRESIKNDIQIGKKIGDAITHAIEEWKTEIISISFGNEDMSWEIRDAIEKAIKQNVIVLAAAGNSGNRKGIPYPAVEDDVFKIFASKSNGYAAGFSPPPSHAPDYSYFIYGDGVVSTWPSSLLEQAKSNGLEVFPYNYEGVEEHSKNASGTWTLLSGTSFATPLAAALVAIIYQFHDVNKSSKSPIRLRHENKSNFKSRKAVRAIFTQMSRTSDKAPYNVLEPARGKDDNFLFRPHKFTGPHKASPLNIWDQTPIQFFSKRLTDILYIANV
ncbi:subtilisin-like protein [Mytilinidion resinicola]|uniref:Subtilisin-like protein n=1 Tax=Mytilinidion resinicola TaxID=574789 RepID=A0A6A6YA62_9PEZI|nr:subtilisin-like protein [Mytilinidion resinicola]KAF2805711.1 subtilisin-like protein [Mytilinidion resinicola]